MGSGGMEWLADSTFNEFGLTSARELSAVELLRRLGRDTATTARKDRIDANEWIQGLAGDTDDDGVVTDRQGVVRAGEADGWAFATRVFGGFSGPTGRRPAKRPGFHWTRDPRRTRAFP